MKTRTVAIVLGVGVLVGAGVRWWSDSRAGTQEAGAGPAVAGAAREEAGQPVQEARGAPPGVRADGGPALAREALPSMPTSLQGTEADGALRVDASGHLVLSADVRLLFDYYLSATGEDPPEVIRARILAALKAKLPPGAVEEAVRLLDDYLAYREATRTLQVPSGSTPEDLGGRLEALRRLRREHMGEVAAEAFFGAEEQLDSVALERMRLEKDGSLTPEERARRISALEERLPGSLRTQREEALRPLRQQAEERELVATGASAEDLHHYRVSTVGEEATARLEALDQQRAQWKQRLEAFRAKREALRLAGPDPAAREAAVQRLLIDSSTPEERLRVEASDALDAERARRQGAAGP